VAVREQVAAVSAGFLLIGTRQKFVLLQPLHNSSHPHRGPDCGPPSAKLEMENPLVGATIKQNNQAMTVWSLW
jgi:hypothetical protein